MSSNSQIPFNRPSISGNELKYIAEAIRLGHASGDGFYTKQCHAFLEKELHTKKALLTTSCTHALEMSALLLNIQPGDEIIVPSYTFTSTINAFVLYGARPVFCDVRPDTFNIDETLIEPLITSKTKAIVPVHYAGVACEMDPILSAAKEHGLSVVEDNAQGIFGKYKGKPLGSLGCLGTLSFHETKNINCGEGGALLVNDLALIERAEIIREKGTNRSQFFRGQVDKYGWVDVGSSFLPSDILAAYLWAQLESSSVIQSKRKLLWDTYFNDLRFWANAYEIQLPAVPDHVEQSYHMFYLVFPNLKQRTAFIAHMKSKNISSVFHYQALNASPMGLRLGGFKGQCPVSEAASDRLVRLPFFNSMTKEDQQRVIDAVIEFKPSIQKSEASPFPKVA